ncbi:MAG: TonB-dependent receptor [Gammaproteobacteria bacterium]|nr:TonB-dependent receptor [Gammaproteobacteria bacterium]
MDLRACLRPLCAFVAAVALGIPLGAAAQELEEIIVTARKRDESLLEAPLSITVFTAEDLSRAGLETLGDISLQTTGLSFQDNIASNRPGRQNSVIRFRGMSPPGGSPHQQLAGLFIDGVYVTGGSQSVPMLDVERVEVIKGPQSAFFGRNTFSGAINYVTRNPSLAQFEGKARASAGQHDQTNIAASFGGPLIENRLGWQVGLSHYNKGAMYIANDGGGLGEESSQSASLTLFATPTENLSIRLRLFDHEDDDGPPAIAYLPGSNYDTCAGTTIRRPDNDGNIAALLPKQYICGRIPLPSETGAPDISVNTTLYPAIFTRITHPMRCPDDCSNWLVENLANNTTLDGVPERRTMGMSRGIFRSSLELDYGLANGMNVSFKASYNDHGVNWIRDFDMTDIESFWTSDPQRNEDRGAELRLSSSVDSRINWLVGASYFKQEIALSGVGGDVVVACFIPEAAGCFGPLFVTLPPTQGEIAKTRGIFAAATIPLGEQFALDLETRHMADERVTGGLGADYNELIPRVILRWQPNDNINIYASYSRGVLPGVLNTNLINASREAFREPYIDRDTGMPSTESEYDQIRRKAPEAGESTPTQELDAIEVGIKASLLGGRGQISAAAYYYEWVAQLFSNFVVYYQDAADPSMRDGVAGPQQQPRTLEFNFPGDSNLWGVEIESSWILSDHWAAGANLAWQDNEYTTFAATFVQDITGSRNLAGNQSGRYPELMGNASLSYADTLTADWDFFARSDFMYYGGTWAGNGGNLARLDGYWLTNLRAGVERDNLRLELFVNNALEQDTWVGAVRNTDFTRFTGFMFNIHGLMLAPQDLRSIGVQVDWSF